MKTSVYISSEKIYVMEYSRGGIRSFVTKRLPEGSIINGMITDPAQLVECLSDLKRANPALLQRAVLVVDGSSVLVKRIEAPKLPKRQYDALIRYDFAHSTNHVDDLVCGYQVLNEGAGESAILACAADISLVESYIETFRAAGIELEAIHVGIQAILNYIAGRGDLQDKTFLLNVVDGFTLLSMIFDRGKSVLIQRSRLYGDDDLQMAGNIRENLSRLLQFVKSEDLSEITDSYYLGIPSEVLRLLEAQSMFGDVRLHKLDIGAAMETGEALPDDAHFVYLNTRLADNSINFIQERRERIKRQKRARPRNRWIPALALFAIALSVPAAVLFLLGRGLDAEIRQIEDYINAPSVVSKIEVLTELERDTESIADIVSRYDAITAAQDALAPVSDELLALVIHTYSGYVDITSFDYTEATGILYLSGTCLGESVAARYVNELRGSSQVAEIDYTGYSYRSTGEYDFSIEVTLNTEQEAAR